MNEYRDYIILGVWVAAIAIIFAILWRKGQLARLRNFILETREELKKCTWPTWRELRESTVVVMVAIVLLGCFTVAVDFVIALLIRAMTQI